MSARIGIEVRAADVRAVLMHSGSLRWYTTAPIGDSTSVFGAIDGLLATVPRVGMFRPPVVVAVSFARAQVKRLDGLPVLTARGEMTQVLRENAESVFLRTTGVVAIPEVHRFSDGATWGAAIDRAVIDDVVSSATGRGFRVLSFLPSSCALARLYPSTTIEVADGAAAFAITTRGGELRVVRRSRASGALVAIPDALREIGDDAQGYLGAYAAALTHRRAPLSWRAEPAPAIAALARRVRMSSAVLGLLVAGAMAIAGPAMHQSLFVRQTARSIESSSTQQVEAARVESELLRTTQLLNAVADFGAGRGQLTQLLAQLTQTLPESTAIVSLRVDSTEGSFVAVSPHVADLLGELGTVDQMSSPRIIGSVTREMVAGVRLERAAFRFRRPRHMPGRQ